MNITTMANNNNHINNQIQVTSDNIDVISDNECELASDKQQQQQQQQQQPQQRQQRRHRRMKLWWSNYSCCCWKRFIEIGILFQIIANYGLGTAAIRNVSLLVDPPAVRRGQHATLKCVYDLEGAPLYSVKFYRGLREFYRYSPSEVPSSKTFPFPGIHVDLSLSNASQVVIRNVGFSLSGNFSCEVTADAPSFSTATAHIQMQVVELPEKRPSLWTDRDRYEPGDVLKANCSSPPSRPRVELTLTLNNIVTYSGESQYIQTTEGLVMSRISLRLHLQSSHFGGGPVHGTHNGLVLRCTAQIGNLYQENAEVELGVPQRDPIPARVTSSTAHRISQPTIKTTSIATLQLLLAIILLNRYIFR